MKAPRRQLSLKKPLRSRKTVSLLVRPQMLKRGERLVKNKNYPGYQLIRRLAGLLASRFLAERN